MGVASRNGWEKYYPDKRSFICLQGESIGFFTYLSGPPKYLIACDLPDKNDIHSSWVLLMRRTDMHKSYPDGQMTRHHWVWAMLAAGPGLPSVQRCDVGAPCLHRGCRLADGLPGSHECQRLPSENDHHISTKCWRLFFESSLLFVMSL